MFLFTDFTEELRKRGGKGGVFTAPSQPDSGFCRTNNEGWAIKGGRVCISVNKKKYALINGYVMFKH